MSNERRHGHADAGRTTSGVRSGYSRVRAKGYVGDVEVNRVSRGGRKRTGGVNKQELEVVEGRKQKQLQKAIGAGKTESRDRYVAEVSAEVR